MRQISVLWVDDEIELLQPHIMFLEEKGYHMLTASNGEEAIEMVKEHDPDLIFLDEHMPGMSGLEVLKEIKSLQGGTPVVMITKSEEEDIMEEAIGAQISDYLIKPVNPKQVLLTIKKFIDTRRLVSEKTTSQYQTEFSQIGLKINESFTFDDWAEVYKKLVFWELELQKSEGGEMSEVLQMQKVEANNGFSKYVEKNYLRWLSADDEGTDKPVLSPNIFKNHVFPLVDKGEKVFVFIIDNLRYDQWKMIAQQLQDIYRIEHEQLMCSILPTTTQYARNAMFAGLMPRDIDEILPDLWLSEEEEGGKNQFEPKLLAKQLSRLGKKYRYSYDKVLNRHVEKKVMKKYHDFLNNDLTMVVYNFVDMMSHAKTNMDMIKELASDEAAYRTLTLSWFVHSSLFDFFKRLSEEDVTVVVTSDHGATKVHEPVKIVSEKEASRNLRFKNGKMLNYDPKEVIEIKNPEQAHLPGKQLNQSFIFAKNNDYFVYPNNYNYYVKYFRNTFQHGGVSLEEMLIPFAVLRPVK